MGEGSSSLDESLHRRAPREHLWVPYLAQEYLGSDLEVFWPQNIFRCMLCLPRGFVSSPLTPEGIKQLRRREEKPCKQVCLLLKVKSESLACRESSSLI